MVYTTFHIMGFDHQRVAITVQIPYLVALTKESAVCIRGIYCFSFWVHRMNCEVPGLMLCPTSQFVHILLLMSEFCLLSGRRRFELVNGNLWFHELVHIIHSRKGQMYNFCVQFVIFLRQFPIPSTVYLIAFTCCKYIYQTVCSLRSILTIDRG